MKVYSYDDVIRERERVDEIIREVAYKTKRQILQKGNLATHFHDYQRQFLNKFCNILDLELKEKLGINFEREILYGYEYGTIKPDIFILGNVGIAVVEVKASPLIFPQEREQCQKYADITALCCYLINFGNDRELGPNIIQFEPKDHHLIPQRGSSSFSPRSVEKAGWTPSKEDMVDKIIREVAYRTKRQILQEGNLAPHFRDYQHNQFAKKFCHHLNRELKEKRGINFEREKIIPYEGGFIMPDILIRRVAVVEVKVRKEISQERKQCQKYADITRLCCYLINFGNKNESEPYIRRFEPKDRQFIIHESSSSLTPRSGQHVTVKEKEDSGSGWLWGLGLGAAVIAGIAGAAAYLDSALERALREEEDERKKRELQLWFWGLGHAAAVIAPIAGAMLLIWLLNTREEEQERNGRNERRQF